MAAFANTWEKVEISNNGTGGTAYVSLPAGTDGQEVMYARFRYSWTAGANAVIVRQPDNATYCHCIRWWRCGYNRCPHGLLWGRIPLGYPVSNQQSVISKESSK
ncbi:MAG: hypothetical protein IPM83_12275 [Ignavibacteria bacterium]|nr:hypothetical protein [Ignavibacteria bacterium]